MAADNILNLKWNGIRSERSREIRSHSKLVQAFSSDFSFVGRSATRSYACVRLVRRWFWEGSERMRFRRVSRFSDLGAFVGAAGGAKFEGSFPLIVCESATVV